MRVRGLLIPLILGSGMLACGGSSKSAAAPEKPGKIVVTDTSIEILGAIAFVDGGVDVAPTSAPMLDAVAATILRNKFRLVVVQVRVPDDGRDPAARQELAARRAKVVLDQLVSRNVPASRLDSEGLAEPPPNPDSYQVMFVLVQRGPE